MTTNAQRAEILLSKLPELRVDGNGRMYDVRLADEEITPYALAVRLAECQRLVISLATRLTTEEQG